MIFVVTAKTKKKAEKAKRFYEKHGVPILVKEQDGKFVLLTKQEFGYAVKNTRFIG